MKVQVIWDERYPSLFMAESSEYMYGTEIDIHPEMYLEWCKVCKTLQEIEDKVREIESSTRS